MAAKSFLRSFSCLAASLALQVIGFSADAAKTADAASNAVFLLGLPDGGGLEFGCAEGGWQTFAGTFRKPVLYAVGKDKPDAWPYIHPSTADSWAGGKAQTFAIQFDIAQVPAQPQHLIIGFGDNHPNPSLLIGALNGAELFRQRAPAGTGSGDAGPGDSVLLPLLVTVPANSFRAGSNEITLTLTDGSWLIYDYIYLGPVGAPPSLTPNNLLAKYRAGPMAGVDDLIFAVRKASGDPHWYANFGYLASDNGKSRLGNGDKLYRDGGRLCRLSLATGAVRNLLDDPRGSVRDPQAHYSARKILFSYRPGGSEHYHLYEISAEGFGLRQLTDGDCDDIEPSYLPDGGIVFVSSRCNRWVNCWLTQVAILYRCDADGGSIRPISSNNEQDNTPWPLPDGRILYTRWEYVDRSQVDYHHLWAVNPDGAAQTVFYGNLHPGTLMIDAKPIPGSNRVLAIFSPGHGDVEHQGFLTVVDPAAGPDEPAFARRVSRTQDYRDPWAFSEGAFLAARHHSLVLLDGAGATQEIFRLSADDIKAGLAVHEPRPLVARSPERVMTARTNPAQSTGRLLLADVYAGRNMAGVKRGDIKKLLVLETLPKPINYTGGMDPLSYGGTFTLERILGAVPVEADGSAYFEVPALRSVFFVALDQQDLSVKRMQSFVTVQPGEVTGCVGCHEQRTKAPANAPVMAALRLPSRIQPIRDAPDVFDFPRDIQPVLDALCVGCHSYEKTAVGGPRAGKLILSGDRGPMFSHSYYEMTIRALFSDGRNRPRSNYAPRTLGSSDSKILKMLDGSHYGVKATPVQEKSLRLWIETGAAYPGTYAALGTGMIGGYAQNQQVNTDSDWPASKAGAEAITRRCESCHKEPSRLLPKSLSDECGVSFWQPEIGDPRLNASRHIVFNLSRPDKSLILLGPLAEAAGGWGLCRDPRTRAPMTVFANTADPDYRKILAMCEAGKDRLEQIKRFDMPGFRPRNDWVREMKRYGVLPPDVEFDDPIDIYTTERKYWGSLWYRAE